MYGKMYGIKPLQRQYISYLLHLPAYLSIIYLCIYRLITLDDIIKRSSYNQIKYLKNNLFTIFSTLIIDFSKYLAAVLKISINIAKNILMIRSLLKNNGKYSDFYLAKCNLYSKYWEEILKNLYSKGIAMQSLCCRQNEEQSLNITRQ